MRLSDGAFCAYDRPDLSANDLLMVEKLTRRSNQEAKNGKPILKKHLVSGIGL